MATLTALSIVTTGLTAVFPAAAAVQSGPDPVVLPLTERGEGAPSQVGQHMSVIVTDQRSSSPWYRSVDRLVEHGVSEVIRIIPWDADKAFARLARLQPGTVYCVFPPDRITVNFHYDFLERATRLDDDPFVDFHFGYLTGPSPEKAEEFTISALSAPGRTLTNEVLDFGPGPKPSPISRTQDHAWANGFRTRRWEHEEDIDVVERLVKFRPRGILSVFGNGIPTGVDRGWNGRQFKDSELDLSSCVVFAGPSYSGLPTVWYDTTSGRVEKFKQEPRDSVLLGLIGARAGAIIGSLDEGIIEFNHQEREHLILGSSVGEVTKGTYDDIVLARRKADFKLRPYVEGKEDPHRNADEEAVAAGAARALFGIPTWRPYEKGSPSPFEVDARLHRGGIELDWSGSDSIERYWLPVDVLRGNGGWTHRLRFRVVVPEKEARRIYQMQIQELSRDGKELPHSRATGAIELWGGTAILHANVTYATNPDDRALQGGRRYRAKLRFMR